MAIWKFSDDAKQNEKVDKNVSFTDKGYDLLLREAANVILLENRVGTSVLQRKFSIGYYRVTELIHQLEVLKIISLPNKNNEREILIDESELEYILSNLPDYKQIKNRNKRSYSHNTDTLIESSQESIEDSEKELEEIRKTMEDVRSATEAFKLQASVEKYRDKTPSAMKNLDVLKEWNTKMETTTEVRELLRCKENIFKLLDKFARYEILYPDSPFLLVNGAETMKSKFLIRFNEMVYRVAQSQLETYKTKLNILVQHSAKERKTISFFKMLDDLRDMVIIEASNSNECFNSLNEIHYQVEDLFSDIQ
jgi:hypothetical protein